MVKREDHSWPIILLSGQTSQDIVVRRRFLFCELRDDIFTFAWVEVSKEQLVMDLRVDEEKNIAYIKIKGKVSSEFVLEAFDVAVSSERYRKGMGRLWDFTDIVIASLDSSVISEMAQYFPSFPPGIRDVKVAFVVT